MSRKVRLTQVAAMQVISPNLKRITLKGDDLNDFPTGQDGAHVKVLLPHSGQTRPNLDINGHEPAVKRSYTIREFNSVKKQLILDFVINRHQGPATNWAAQAKVGDYLGIAGPGVRKLTNFNTNSYLLIGDITSVNAVNGYAKFIAKKAQLTAIVTVPTRADIILMDAGEHLNVHWHVEDESSVTLVDFVHGLVVNLARDSQVFIGLEASQLRSIKSLLLNELEFNRLNIHATGYWKKGMDADRFGADKKRNPL
jgi:NADPH-dependent ferric siderophore reductase